MKLALLAALGISVFGAFALSFEARAAQPRLKLISDSPYFHCHSGVPAGTLRAGSLLEPISSWWKYNTEILMVNVLLEESVLRKVCVRGDRTEHL